MGRLVADPELRQTPNGIAVASFRLAVDRNYQTKGSGERQADFINCVAWRQTGEFVGKYFTKGRMAVVSGRLQIRGWTDKDGSKRRTAEVNADHVYFGDSKKELQNDPSALASYLPPAYPAARYAAPSSDFAMLEDDDAQLPF